MGRIIKAAELAEQRESDPPSPEAISVGAAAVAGSDTAALKTLVFEIAEAMANALVGEDIDRAPTLLDGIYRKALAQVTPMNGATLVVHPEDAALHSLDDIAVEKGVSVIADSSVGRGGFRLFSRFGEVDGTLDTLLSRLGDTARGVVG